MASEQSKTSLDAASLFRVDGLVALVTGGGTGIGYMIAKALAQNGAAKVYIAARRAEVLQTAASSLGPNVHPLVCDVTDKDSLTRAAAKIKEEVGYLNLLVCNSGISGPQSGVPQDNSSLEAFVQGNWKISIEDYTQTFNVNVASVWYTTLAFLQLLDGGNKKKNIDWSSQVVIVSSVAAFNKKAPGGWAYGQSKVAALHAMKNLSVELAQWQIRSNSICPGLFPSEMSAPLLERYNPGNDSDAMPTSIVPMGRAGDEKDMGATMLYLASRAGAYLTGAAILIDGGRLSNFPSVY